MIKCCENPKFLCFIGGIAAALAGRAVAKSPRTRQACVNGIAKSMCLHQDAQVAFRNMKEDAEDLCSEARQRARQRVTDEAPAAEE